MDINKISEELSIISETLSTIVEEWAQFVEQQLLTLKDISWLEDLFISKHILHDYKETRIGRVVSFNRKLYRDKIKYFIA